MRNLFLIIMECLPYLPSLIKKTFFKALCKASALVSKLSVKKKKRLKWNYVQLKLVNKIKLNDQVLSCYTLFMHHRIFGPWALRKCLNRAVIQALVFFSDVGYSDAAIHRWCIDELNSTIVSSSEIDTVVGVINGKRIRIDSFGPWHHDEVTTPGARAVQQHPVLKPHCAAWRLQLLWDWQISTDRSMFMSYKLQTIN